ncbi:dihydrofolate reductase [Tardiphaga alba]|uniref:Dihydrofolate reductase n=1 Tax=Tardiphaga alba TaxID=340268 RepID=A0ABX8A5Y7_9BRAD|nr:dihydrofolate reductase [Tardiphaga alba]QUS39012.1 dihydrofolate reductase [Tardiphaga alba]
MTAKVSLEIVLVYAIAENGVIGNGNAIPWRLKSDMQRFKALTIGKPIVMGRKTFESFPRRPLPGRTNILITRNADYTADGAVVVTSLDAARAAATGDALRRGGSEIAIIGGAEIYTLWMPHADRLEVTEVHANPVGDTTMPAVDLAIWEETMRVRHPAAGEDSVDFSYVTYCRRAVR